MTLSMGVLHHSQGRTGACCTIHCQTEGNESPYNSYLMLAISLARAFQNPLWFELIWIRP